MWWPFANRTIGLLGFALRARQMLGSRGCGRSVTWAIAPYRTTTERPSSCLQIQYPQQPKPAYPTHAAAARFLFYNIVVIMVVDQLRTSIGEPQLWWFRL